MQQHTLHVVLSLLVKSNLRRSLGILSVFVKGTIGSVFLLLDSGAKLHQIFRYGLIRCLEYIDQSARLVSSTSYGRQMPRGPLTSQRAPCPVL